MAPVGFENPGQGNVKIKILRNTVCDAKDVRAGDVIETSKREAHILIREAMAERFTEEVKPQTELQKKTKAELVEHAKAEHGVDLDASQKKDKLIAAIEAAKADAEQK